ncbi:hypothetical protein F2Q68_00008078 [Brassica cretica]|uniref:Uncharacterized protein n=1 Tax=Brassica cretica TaxID=69181 RepID=A0A8S9L1L4_BRACR|nr:hypothetical protein F2Q68_00008078 [Brassica cretica]
MGESMGVGLFGLGVVVRISLEDSGTAVARRCVVIGSLLLLHGHEALMVLDSLESVGVGFFVSSVWVSQLDSKALSSVLDSLLFLPELSSVRSWCSTFAFVGELSIVKLRFADVVPFLGFKPTGSSKLSKLISEMSDCI